MKTYNKDPVHFDNFSIALDSGAHSIYIEKFVKAAKGKTNANARKYANYDFADSDEFKNYLESYIAHLHEHKDYYDFYVTLDVIANPKKTAEVLQYMESCGLNPMPVFHVGSDLEILKRMMDKYDYIGIGGLGQDVSKKKYKPFADSIFKLLCDDKGHPRIKTHGFAMTSPELILKYPWYTCDSSTWTSLSRNGTVYIPKPIVKNNEIEGYDYTRLPIMLPVTTRRAETDKRHIDHQSPIVKKAIEHYFELNGVSFEMAREGPLGYDIRDLLNIKFHVEFEKWAKKVYAEKYDFEEGAKIYLAGNPSGASTNRTRVVDLFGLIKEPSLRMLGSFYYPLPNGNLLEFRKAFLENRDLRTLQKRKKKPKLKKSKPKIQFKKKPQTVSFEVKLRYDISYTVTSEYYPTDSLEDIASKELQDIHNNPHKHLNGNSPCIEVTAQNAESKITVSTETKKPIPQTQPTGFFF